MSKLVIPRTSLRTAKPPLKTSTPRGSVQSSSGSPTSVNSPAPEQPARRARKPVSSVLPATLFHQENSDALAATSPSSSNAFGVNKQELRLVWQGIETLDNLDVQVTRPKSFDELLEIVNEKFRSAEAREAGGGLDPFYFTDAQGQTINKDNYLSNVLMMHHARTGSVNLLCVYDEHGPFKVVRHYQQQFECIPHPGIISPEEYYSAARQGEKPLAYAIGEFLDNCLSAFAKVRKVNPAFKGEISIVFHEITLKSRPGVASESRLRILIKDNGCGMDQKALTSFARVADRPEDRGDQRVPEEIALDGANNYVNQSISQFGVGAKFAAFYLSKEIVISTKPMGSSRVFEMNMNKEAMNTAYNLTGNAFLNEILTRQTGDVAKTKMSIHFANQIDQQLDNTVKSETNRAHFTHILLDCVYSEHLPEVRQQAELVSRLASLYHRVLYGPWGRGQDDANKQTEFHSPLISLSYFKDDKEIWKCPDLRDSETDLQSVYYSSHKGDIFRFAMLAKLADSPTQFWIRGEILYFPRDMEGETNPAVQELNDRHKEVLDKDGDTDNYRAGFKSIQIMFNLLWHGRLIPLSHCPTLYFMHSVAKDHGREILQRMHGFLHVSYPLVTDRVKLHMSQDLATYLTRGDPKRTNTVIEDISLDPKALGVLPERTNRARALAASFKAQVSQWMLLDAAIKFARSDLLSDLSKNETKAIYSRAIMSVSSGQFVCARGNLLAVKERTNSKEVRFMRVCCIMSDLSAGDVLRAALGTTQLTANSRESYVIGFIEPVRTMEVPNALAFTFIKSQSCDLAVQNVTTFGNKPLSPIEISYAKKRLCRVPLRNIQTDWNSQRVEQEFNLSNPTDGWPSRIKVFTDKQLDGGLIIRGRCGLTLPGNWVVAYDKLDAFVKEETVVQTFYRVQNGTDEILDYAECDRVDLSVDSQDDVNGDVHMTDAEQDDSVGDRRSSRRSRSSVAMSSSGSSSSAPPVTPASRKRVRVKPEEPVSAVKRKQRHPLCAFRRPDYNITRVVDRSHETKVSIALEKSARGFTHYTWSKPGVYQVEWKLKHKVHESDRNDVPPVTITVVIVPDLPRRFKAPDARESLQLGAVDSSPVRIEMFDEHENMITPAAMRGGRFPILQAKLECLEPELDVDCDQPVLQASEGDSDYVINNLKFVPGSDFRLSSATGQDVKCRITFYDGDNRDANLGRLDFTTTLTPGDAVELNLAEFPARVQLPNGSLYKFILSQCDQFQQPAAKPLRKQRTGPQQSIAYPRLLLKSSSPEMADIWGSEKVFRESFDAEGQISQADFSTLPPIWLPPSVFLNKDSVDVTIQAICEWEPRRSTDITSHITVKPRKELAFVSISTSPAATPPQADGAPVVQLSRPLNQPVDLFLHFYTETREHIKIRDLRRLPEMIALHSDIRIEIKGLENVGDTPFFCSLEDLDDDGRIRGVRTPSKPAPADLTRKLQCQLVVVLDGDDSALDVKSVESRLRYRLRHDSPKANFLVDLQCGPPAKVVLDFPSLSGYNCGDVFGDRVRISFADKDGFPVNLHGKQALAFGINFEFKDNRGKVKGLQPVAVSSIDNPDVVTHFNVASASIEGKVGVCQMRVVTQSRLSLEPSDWVEIEIKPGSPYSMRAFLVAPPRGENEPIQITPNCVIPDRVMVDRLMIQMYDEVDNEATIPHRYRAVFAHFVDARGQTVPVYDKSSNAIDRVPVIIDKNKLDGRILKFSSFTLRATAGAPLTLVIQSLDATTRQPRLVNPAPLHIPLIVVPLPGRVRSIDNLFVQFKHTDISPIQRLALDPALLSGHNGAPSKVMAGSVVTRMGVDVSWIRDPVQSIFLDADAGQPPVHPAGRFVATWKGPGGGEVQVQYSQQWNETFRAVAFIPSPPISLNATGNWTCVVRYEDSSPLLFPNERTLESLPHGESVMTGPPAHLSLPQLQVSPVTNQSEGTRTIATALKLTLRDQFNEPVHLKDLSLRMRESLLHISTDVRPVDGAQQSQVPQVKFSPLTVELNTSIACIVFNSIVVESNTVAPNGEYELVFQLAPPLDSFKATYRFHFSDDNARVAALNRENQKRDQARAELAGKKEQLAARQAQIVPREQAVRAMIDAWMRDSNGLSQSLGQLLNNLNRDLQSVREFDYNEWTRFKDSCAQRIAAMTEGPAQLGLCQKLRDLHTTVSHVRSSAEASLAQFPEIIPDYLHFKNASGQPLTVHDGFIGVLGALAYVEDVNICRAVSFCRESGLRTPLVRNRTCAAFSFINQSMTQSRRRGQIMMAEGQSRRDPPRQMPHEQARVAVSGNPRFLINLMKFPPSEYQDAVRSAYQNALGNTMVIDTMRDLDLYRQALQGRGTQIPSIIAIAECKERAANNTESIGLGSSAPSFERLEVRLAVKPSSDLTGWLGRLGSARDEIGKLISLANQLDQRFQADVLLSQKNEISLSLARLREEKELIDRAERDLTMILRPVMQRGIGIQKTHHMTSQPRR